MIVGTRPEAIKLAPVVFALERRGLVPLIVFTGQHPGLEPAEHSLDGYPAIRLGCSGLDDPHVHVGTVTAAVVPVLTDASPALVVVQGDTSSALGGALAAKLVGTPVAHVEAGLRSHDRRRPWPEEEFRVAIDANSELLFAPTQLNAANLRRERVAGHVHVTGNSGVDAVLAHCRPQAVRSNGSPPLVLVTCHRRENWGRGISGVAAALRHIASGNIARVEVILHPNPAVSMQIRQMLLGQREVEFRQPCGHAEAIAAMLRSTLVLSDSGGMQEEAAALGVPLLVLRDKTERPEAVACGSLELVGTDPDRIVTAVRRRLDRPSPVNASLHFGDGSAGEKIAQAIGEWLSRCNCRAGAVDLVHDHNQASFAPSGRCSKAV